MNIGSQQPPRITADTIKNAKTFECICGGKIFSEKMILKKISALISPTGREETFPMNILICESCGKVPRELDPENMIPEEFKTQILTNKN